jgi:hypothetical protein
MNADKHRIPMAVCPVHSLIQIHEGVVSAHQNDTEIRSKLATDALGHVESEIFFRLTGVAADGSRIATSMAGIEDHRFKSFGARAVTPFIEPL